MPVTATLQLEDVLSLHSRHEFIVALQPVVTAGVNPADVVAAVGFTSLVRHHSNQLIAAGVEA